MGGIVIPTELQVSELTGGVGNGMLGLDLGSGLIGGADQSFQALSDLVGNCLGLGILLGGGLTALIIKSGSGYLCGRDGSGMLASLMRSSAWMQERI